MTLQELLDQKGTSIIYVTSSTRILDAIHTMCDHKVGSLLVTGDDDRLCGIVTERDILRFCADHDGSLGEALISEVMTPDLVVATPDWTTDQAMSLMTGQRFRHLPVLSGGRPMGMISIGDLVKAKLKDVSVEVKYLRDYISA